MKKNELKEISDKSLDQLREMLKVYHEQIKKLEVEKSSGKNKNVNATSGKKKDIARILTFIRKKELAKI